MGWSRFFRRARWDEERAQEIEAYLLHEIDDNLARGMTPGEATSAAHRKLGNATRIREDIYEMNTLPLLETTLQDLRHGVRLLRKSPTFSLVAILTLALGTGANAAIFQLVNAVRFRALPVERPHELVSIGIDMHGKGRVGMGYLGAVHTEALWLHLRSDQEAFSSLVAWGGDTWDLSPSGELVAAEGLYVSGNWFESLGIRAHVGRLFTAADDRRGCGAPGAVLSYGFWQARYGGDPGVIGRKITLNRHPFDILGVAPPGFFGVEVGRGFDVATPLCAEPLLRGDRAGTGRAHVWWLAVMGRLRPGWTVPQAAAHLAAISPAVFEATVPPSYNAATANSYRANTLTATPAAAGVSSVRTRYATHLWLLLGATGLVLLITCANLANLMLARATTRHREIAVRLAIGASRARVVRQLLAESILIAGCAVAVGLVLAAWLSDALVVLLGSQANSIVLDVRADWRVFAFAAVVAVLACAVFGLAPALRATRVDPGRALQGGGRAATVTRKVLGFRRGLVVAQVALSTVLVVTALLFARSLRNLESVELGFRPDVLAVNIDLRRSPGPADGRQQALAEILAGIRATPGVRHAAAAFIVPLSGPDWNGPIRMAGVEQSGIVHFNSVGDDYFRTLDTTLLAGRAFGPQDDAGAPKVAVVNETFARRYFPGRDAIGQTFELEAPGGPPPTYRVIGLARDTKYQHVREEPLPIVYLAMPQEPEAPTMVAIVVRSDLPFASVTPALTRAITRAAPGASVSYDTVEEYLRGSLRTDRLMTSLSGAFGLLALVIAVVGLYGVMAYTAARRRVEIGIRMALGADPRAIVRMMLADSALLLVLGGGIGVALAAAVSGYATRLLYGVRALDPASFAVAAGVLGVVSLMAAWIPARQASKVPPTGAIRE